MKIGILKTGTAPDQMRATSGDYPALFAHLLAGQGFDFVTYDVEAMVFPDSPLDADGWLITGSRHGVYEPHPFIAPLAQFIRDAFAVRRPVVGICFGHQIMAQALGGQVEKFAGGWIVGAQDYAFGADALTLNAWHQDQVVTPPPGALTLASSPNCAHAALGYGDLGFSVQAHPEFDDICIQTLIDTRGPGVVPDPILRAAEGQQGGARHADRIARQIAAHFHQHSQTFTPSETP
ncbi:MAG: type 1 glutamine amidotransferase [Roseinatronobacter sp.]